MELELEFKKGVDVDFLHDRLEEAAIKNGVKIPGIDGRRWLRREVFEKLLLIEALRGDIQALTNRIQDFAISRHYRTSEHTFQREREEWYTKLRKTHEEKLRKLREELGL